MHCFCTACLSEIVTEDVARPLSCPSCKQPSVVPAMGLLGMLVANVQTPLFLGFPQNSSLLDFLALLPGNPILVTPSRRIDSLPVKPAKPAPVKAAEIQSRFRWGRAYDASECTLLESAVSIDFFKRCTNGEESKSDIEKELLSAFTDSMSTSGSGVCHGASQLLCLIVDFLTPGVKTVVTKLHQVMKREKARLDEAKGASGQEAETDVLLDAGLSQADGEQSHVCVISCNS